MIDDVKGSKAGTLTENRMRAEHFTLANGEHVFALVGDGFCALGALPSLDGAQQRRRDRHRSVSARA